MKRIYFFIFFVISTYGSLFSQDAGAYLDTWQQVDVSQPSPMLSVVMANKGRAFIAEQQDYTATVQNISGKRLHITGYIFANLTCGNQDKNNFDLFINPGQKLGGNAYLFDNTNLTGQTESNECKGNPIYVNGQQMGVNMIANIGISINVVVDDSAQKAQVQRTQDSLAQAKHTQDSLAAAKQVQQNNQQAQKQVEQRQQDSVNAARKETRYEEKKNEIRANYSRDSAYHATERQQYNQTFETYKSLMTNSLLKCPGTKYGCGAFDFGFGMTAGQVPLIKQIFYDYTATNVNHATTSNIAGEGGYFSGEWWMYRNEYCGGSIFGNMSYEDNFLEVGVDQSIFTFEYGIHLYGGSKHWKGLINLSRINQTLVDNEDLATELASSGITDTLDITTLGSANYNIFRLGFGIMYDFTPYDDAEANNDEFGGEQFISLEILWDRPSFIPSNYPASQVARLHFRCFLDVYIQYSSNYFVGGDNVNKLPFQGTSNQNYWYVGMGKVWRLHYFYKK